MPIGEAEHSYSRLRALKDANTGKLVCYELDSALNNLLTVSFLSENVLLCLGEEHQVKMKSVQVWVPECMHMCVCVYVFCCIRDGE